MSSEWSAPVQTYFAGKCDDDIEAILAPFAEEAIVRDVDGTTAAVLMTAVTLLACSYANSRLSRVEVRESS